MRFDNQFARMNRIGGVQKSPTCRGLFRYVAEAQAASRAMISWLSLAISIAFWIIGPTTVKTPNSVGISSFG